MIRPQMIPLVTWNTMSGNSLIRPASASRFAGCAKRAAQDLSHGALRHLGDEVDRLGGLIRRGVLARELDDLVAQYGGSRVSGLHNRERDDGVADALLGLAD